jgi:hypothetical protein
LILSEKWPFEATHAADKSPETHTKVRQPLTEAKQTHKNDRRDTSPETHTNKYTRIEI